MKTFTVLLLSLLITAIAFADNITVSGNVKDLKTSAVLDSATVTIVNTQNAGERYSVATSSNGAWSLNFTTDVINLSAAAPSVFELRQNYPNPFNPSTIISYAIPSRAYVTLSVFNTLGQKVAELVNSEMGAGNYNATFDATGLSSGVYLYRINAGNFSETKKLMLVK